MRIKVIQWATGMSGRATIKMLLERPEFELVGVYTHSPKKEGIDAGEICGLPRCGVLATSNVGSLLKLEADCVTYNATDTGRASDAFDDLYMLLTTGKNVVTITPTQLYHPSSANKQVISRLREACEKGKSTLYCTGILPGIMNDGLIFSLTNMSHGIRSIGMAEMLVIPHYDAPSLKAYGFGCDPAEDSKKFDPALLNHYWESGIHFLAEAFRMPLDEIRQFREVEVSRRGFTTSSGLLVEPGTIGAIHWGLQGVVADEVKFTIEHYEWLDRVIAPHWPQPPGEGGYRFTIRGEPEMTLDLAYKGDALLGAEWSAASRVVNVIADVIDAPPGIVSSFVDLPLRPGRMILKVTAPGDETGLP